MAREPESSRIGYSRILGLRASLALGFSVSFGLVLGSSAGVVMSMAGEGVILALGLSLILYLPLLLTYLEMAGGKPGSASAYQISRAFGLRRLSFAVGWLMLSGLVSAAALLSLGLARRLDVSAQSFFGIDIDHFWFLVAAVTLGSAHEWLTSEDRWRSRTVLVWLGLGAFGVVLAWAAGVHPPENLEVPRVKFRGHDLTSVALIAAGLWFVDLLLNHRRQMQRPDQTLRRSILGVWIGSMILALVTASLVLRSPSLLMELWPAKISWGESRLEFLLLLVGILFLWLGLSRIVSRTVRLTGAMALNGYLPPVGGRRRRRLRALVAMGFIAVVIVLVARWMPLDRLVAISAASFLLATTLVTIPYARRPSRELSPVRRNRLPLHPLVPAMSIVISLGLVLVLPRAGLGVLFGWLVVGVAFFLAYAGRRSQEVQQDAVFVGEVDEVQTKTAPRILVGAGDASHLTSLLKLGAAIVRDRQAELVVLRIMPTPDELSMVTAQKAAEEEWQRLEDRVAEFESSELPISTLVRIAPSIHSGILATAREYDADLILVGGGTREGDSQPSAVLTSIFASTSRQMIVVRGQIEKEVLDVVVGTGGGPHSPMALELGAAIVKLTGGQLELVCVVPKGHPEEPAAEALAATLEKAEVEIEVASRVVASQTVESGLVETSRDKSVLILGASVDRLLERTVVGGLPHEVSRVREGTTLIVKRAEAAMRFWQRRLWEFLARHTPTLTLTERSQIYSQMRHSARADGDFYAYISLSSAIAIFGLLLNSAAVIIGAMLVAPLMSPILATAQGIVQGNLRMIQRAGATTLKGASVAIGVATVIAALFAELLPTEQILARTAPNLLDLGVALAAGAVGAWAVSRASGAAAMPGVAIAVALVPPLCVVGYGLGTSQFWISGGAFLLFLTNLAAIILVGALVFVLLGFRPTRVEREAQVRRAAIISLLTVAILIIPLGLTTIKVSRQGRLEAAIKKEVAETSQDSFRVWDFQVSRSGRGFVVEGTIYAFRGFETERVFEFRRYLEDKVGVPVRVQMTVVPATLTVAGEELEPPPDPEPSVLPSE